MNFIRNFSQIPAYTLDIFYPNNCSLCSTQLNSSERYLCLQCRYELPFLAPVEIAQINRTFTGRIDIQQVHALFNYQKGNQASELMRAVKYQGKTKFSAHLGTLLAKKIDDPSIDLIVPLPLHPKKERLRGYNQSLAIAKGVAAELNVPIENKGVRRTKHNPSQTKVSKFDRWENVRSIFEVKKASVFENKHLLLIDDVLTTGATLEACAFQLINECAGTTISVATLAARL